MINTVKCLLVIIVVFIHVLPNSNPALDYSNAGAFFYSFISELISHNIGRMAVPCFFVFSGYLFFISLDGDLSINWLRKKWKKRIKTLLVPYLLWNILLVLCILLKNDVICAGGIKDDFSGQLKSLGLYGSLWGQPLNLPLWYMRDLLCMSVISPLFFYLFRYLNGFGLVLLAVPYYIMAEIAFPGFSTTSMLFFGVGAFMSIKRINLVSLFKTIEIPVYFLAFVLLLTAMAFSGSNTHELVIRLFIPCGIISSVNIVGRFKENALETGTRYCACSFFVYAAHWIYIRNWSMGLSLRLFGDTGPGKFLSYFASPSMTTLFCVGMFLLMRRFMPQILKAFNGGRI